jgi:glycosyltransferase involved in cell wall biosynthesis
MFRKWIRENGAGLDYVLLSRPTVACDFLAELKRHSNAKLVYYGHDLHFLRMRRQAEVQGDDAVLREAREMERVERWVWRSVDIVLHPSAEEAERVAAMEPRVTSRAVLPFCFKAFGEVREPVAGYNILFVAGFAHPPNEDAATWFVQDILPAIRARVPDASLDIVGSNPTSRVLGLAGDSIKITPDVSDRELAAFYQRARVAVVPLRFGAGMKLKVVEALKEGVPLVTTPVGAQGLSGLEEAAAVAEDPDAIADAVCRLLTDDAAWSRAAATQIAFAKTRFSEDALRASLLRGFGLPVPS